MAKKELKAEGEKKYWSGDRDATFAQICELVAEGKPLREICRMPRMPSHMAVYDWAEKDPDKSLRLARARDKGIDRIVEQCMEIADEPPPTTMNGGTDSGYVQHQKLRVETRLKLAAVWNPKKYGSKLEHSGDASAPLQIVVKQYTPDA